MTLTPLKNKLIDLGMSAVILTIGYYTFTYVPPTFDLMDGMMEHRQPKHDHGNSSTRPRVRSGRDSAVGHGCKRPMFFEPW